MLKTIPSTLPTGRWAVDTVATTATFVAREKFGAVVHGHIPVIDGAVTATDGRVAGVTATLDLAAIDTGHPRRDKDLRGKHFFHTAVRPTMRFAAGAAEPTPDGWTLAGTLHVNDRECPMVLAVRLDAGSDAAAGTVRVFASTTIDKRQAGIKAPNWLIRHSIAVEIAATLRLS